MNKKVLPLLLSPLLAFSQVPADKQKHFYVGGIIGVTTSEVVYQLTGNRRTGTYAGVTMAVGAGLLKEVLDRNEPNNRFDGGDMVATAFGGAMFSMSIEIFEKKKPRRFR